MHHMYNLIPSAMTEKNPIKSIEWMLTSKCNYKCSYCCNGRTDDRHFEHSSDAVVDAMLRLFERLDGCWLVKLIGGEPFVHPRFYEVCEGIVQQGHKVCTTTNFSPSREKLQQFIDITGDNLDFLTASLHIEQVKDIDDFIDKAIWYNQQKPNSSSFSASSVVLEENYRQLRDIEQRLTKGNVGFGYQLCHNNGVYIDYPEEIKNYVTKRQNTLASRNLAGMKIHGTQCHTGQYFFVVDTNGQVRRCFMSQLGGKLGNVLNKINLFNSPKPCLSQMCTCDVALNRNLILFDQKVKGAALCYTKCQAAIREIKANPSVIITAVKKRIIKNKNIQEK